MIERDELVRRIRLGEDATLELKRVLLAGSRVTAPKRDEFADELAAMGNGWGGTAVLGAEDRSREIVGIPLDRLDAVEAWVREICNDSVKPPLDALIRKIEVPGADGSLVAVVCVEDRSQPVRPQESGWLLPKDRQLEAGDVAGSSRAAVSGAEPESGHSLRRVACAWNLPGTTRWWIDAQILAGRTAPGRDRLAQAPDCR